MSKEHLDEASTQFKHFLKSTNMYSSVYTKEFVKQFGQAWTVQMQLLHIVSEIGEVYETIRQGTGLEDFLRETVDVILSSFTLLDIAMLHCESEGIDSRKKRDEAIDWVVEKVTKRLKENHYGDVTQWGVEK